jgi:hypothetical protein
MRALAISDVTKLDGLLPLDRLSLELLSSLLLDLESLICWLLLWLRCLLYDLFGIEFLALLSMLEV